MAAPIPSSASSILSSFPESSTIVVGTHNALKIKAVETCLPSLKVVGVSGKFVSNVSEWPIGHEETTKGAEFRAKTALERHPTAVAGIGVESGFHPRTSEDKPWVVFIVAVIVLRSGARHYGVSSDLVCPITDKQRSSQVADSLARCVEGPKATSEAKN